METLEATDERTVQSPASTRPARSDSSRVKENDAHSIDAAPTNSADSDERSNATVQQGVASSVNSFATASSENSSGDLQSVVKDEGELEISVPQKSRQGKKGKESEKKEKESDDDFLGKSPSAKLEREAGFIYQKLSGRIKKLKGHYLRDEAGNFHLLVRGRRIPLNYERDNYDLNSLLLELCNMTVHSPVAKPTISRLINEARNAADKFTLRQFSAMSKDRKRLYVPVKDQSQLLLVTADEIRSVPNGANEDHLYVEHPKLDPDGESLDYAAAPVKEGLEAFERLIVSTQACRVPEMAWFLAMQEGLMPFVRDLFSARFIVHHEGPKGSGKTTGGEFFCLLHGLKPTGDATPASLRRLGDVGLLMMDNREQQDMTQGYDNYLLFLATGTQSLRCVGDEGLKQGNLYRPIGAITSIEGAYKEELSDRLVEVSYNAHERRTRASFESDNIASEITASRHKIVSALMHVLQRFMTLNYEDRATTIPESVARFGGNFRAVCNLLRAYAEIAGKPAAWAEAIISKWVETITLQSKEAGGGELEYLVKQFLRALEREDPADAFFGGGRRHPRDYVELSATVQFQGKRGSLTVTTAGQLLDWLKKEHPYNKAIPRNESGLGRRLRSIQSTDLKILDEANEKELPQLKRKKGERFLGLFEPYGSVGDGPDDTMKTSCHPSCQTD